MNLLTKAFQYIEKNEGGYSNHKNDYGGATKFGISLSFAKNAYKNGSIYLDIDKNNVVNQQDIKLLTIDIAIKNFNDNFFIPSRAAEIENEKIAIKYLDISYLFGAYNATVMMQTSANQTLQDCALQIDGAIGQKTIKSINRCENELFLKNLIDIQIFKHNDVVKKHPEQIKFLNGWISRARRLP